MFCLNCGEKIVLEQVYCRSCGMGLREMSQNLSKDLHESNEKTDWLKRIGLFSIGMISNGILIFALVLYINAFRLDNGFITVLLAIVSTILMGFISVLFFEKNKTSKAGSEIIVTKDYVKPTIEAWKTNRQLNESSFQPIGSVTEDTTELFAPQIGRRKTSGELG